MTDTSTETQEETELHFLKLVADDTRWKLLRALRLSDYQVGELVAQLNLPQNLISYHLGLLRQAGLVRSQRSSADARTQYYGLDVAAFEVGLAQVASYFQVSQQTTAMPMPPRTVIFLCSGNSARSQIAEGWLRHQSGGGVVARSAGTQPGKLHSLAVAVMAEVGIDIGYQHAKDLAALHDVVADVVVTVCDRAREECPAWQAAATRLHWSTPDPASIKGRDEERLAAFRSVRDTLRARVEAFLGLLPGLPVVGACNNT